MLQRRIISRARQVGIAAFASALLVGCSKPAVDPQAPANSATADLATSVGCPANLPRVVPGTNWKCGCYNVDTSPPKPNDPYGPHQTLAHNKQAFIKAGASLDFLTSAMIETDNMDARYIWGDGKTGLSFNAGATKQNWGMIQNAGRWPKTGPKGYGSQYSGGPGHDMAHNRNLDVAVYKDNVAKHGGIDRYLAGHRNGDTGLRNPNTDDIKKFVKSWHWINDRLKSNSEYQRNGIRFYVEIPALP